jgi:hypothetical protein
MMAMTERLLQFIWQFQYFNQAELTAVDGEQLHILHPGFLNTNQGQDFTQAKIKIDSTIFAGNIELHLKTSDWQTHQHAVDANYANIILHVVWQHDAQPNNAPNCPVLVLQDRVSTFLLAQYEQLMLNNQFVPCAHHLPVLGDVAWLAWKERLAAERLERKAQQIMQRLTACNNHWEEVFWRMLARNFGITVNADLFEAVAQTISIQILAKHKNQIHQLEALLLGQANVLKGEMQEDYPIMLQKEYRFLQKKYQLSAINKQPDYLRMRPANFPSVRMAQLAMLIHQSAHLFSIIKSKKTVKEIQDLFDVTANDYWHYHYRMDEPSEYHPKKMGQQMIDNIIINTIVPVLFAYGLFTKDEAVKTKAINWLTQLKPEQNTITRNWVKHGVKNYNALDAQALIELKNNYCQHHKCLDCAVGNAILKRGK